MGASPLLRPDGHAPDEREPLLRVRDLSTVLDTPRGLVRAVERVSLEVRAGEAVALVGESGCGKSMTVFSLLSLLPPTGRVVGGEVHLGGRDLVQLPEREMRAVRGGELGIVFQDPMVYLNPLMRVGDQLAEGVRAHSGCSRRQARAHALDALGQVRIPAPERVLDSFPHQLSGGMRQRVLIAMAIASRPSLLIADEPTTALDVTTQAQIMHLLADLRRELGNGMLLITHDLGLVAEHCDRVYVMYAGQIVEEGDVFDIFAAPQHPYTAALLGNTLSIDRRLEAFAPVGGQPPDLASPPNGCRFHPRCPSVMERCHVDAPPQVALPSGGCARCWLRADDPSAGDPAPADADSSVS